MAHNSSPRPWAVDGPLTFDEVPGWYRRSLGWYRETGLPADVDLGAVEKADSSALALLLEWQSWAARGGRRLRYVNPPDGLRVYARLTDTGAVLGWDKEE